MFSRPLLSFYAPKLRVSTADFFLRYSRAKKQKISWLFGKKKKTWQVANFCTNLGVTITGGKLKFELFFHGPKWLFVMTDYFIVWEGSLDISHSLKPPKINGLEGTM